MRSVADMVRQNGGNEHRFDGIGVHDGVARDEQPRQAAPDQAEVQAMPCLEPMLAGGRASSPMSWRTTEGPPAIRKTPRMTESAPAPPRRTQPFSRTKGSHRAQERSAPAPG